MARRTYDLVLYGATGFTGGLVAGYLSTHAPAGLRWALAGRDAARLATLRDALGVPSVGVVVADGTDADGLLRMAASTAVVCSTVGPYARLGGPLVAACVAARTDYLDLTGEPNFVARTIRDHHEVAREAGVRIVHSCGFDSLPSDLGTWRAQTHTVARHGRPPDRIRTYVRAMRGGFSGGTVASMAEVVDSARALPDDRRALADPYSLGGSGPRVQDLAGVAWDDDAEGWTAPFLMAPINARIVRRTSALCGWGPIDYAERMSFGRGAGAFGRALGVTAGLAGAFLPLATPGVRVLARRMLPASHSGPDEATRNAGFFRMEVVAVVGELRERVRITGVGDPGYASTSGMLAEAAMALAAGSSSAPGGVITPAVAFGGGLFPALARAGVEFGVVGEAAA